MHYTKPVGLSSILGNFPSEFTTNLNQPHTITMLLCTLIQKLSASRESSRKQERAAALSIQHFVAYKSLIIISAVIVSAAGYWRYCNMIGPKITTTLCSVSLVPDQHVLQMFLQGVHLRTFKMQLPYILKYSKIVSKTHNKLFSGYCGKKQKLWASSLLFPIICYRPQWMCSIVMAHGSNAKQEHLNQTLLFSPEVD